MEVCDEYLFGRAMRSGASDHEKIDDEEEEHERKKKGITRLRPDGGVTTRWQGLGLAIEYRNKCLVAFSCLLLQLMEVAMVLSVMRMLNVSSPSMINHFSASVGKVGRVAA